MTAAMQQGVVLVLVLAAVGYVGLRAFRALHRARGKAGPGTGDAACGSGCGCATDGPRRASTSR